MISIKKQLVKQELDTLFAQYPIIVWYQTKQKSTQEWTQLKETLKREISEPESTLNVIQAKTSILKVVLKSKTHKHAWLRTCQGQLLVCGCKTPQDLKHLLYALDKAKDGFVMGGFYGEIPRTFKEIEKLQSLGIETYAQLIQQLQSTLSRFLLLKRLCDFSYLRHINMSLCRTIKQCQQRL